MKTRTTQTTFTTTMMSLVMVGVGLASHAQAASVLPVTQSANSLDSPPAAGSPPSIPVLPEASRPASVYHEAPLLAEQVATGKLPPVDQRLPQNPMLIQPQDRIGRYGGVWHLAMVNTDPIFLLRVMGYESLVRWDVEWTRIIPNVAQSYEASPDSKTFTFKLREGMLWSNWYQNPNGPQSEEPPASVKETIVLYRRLLRTANPDQQHKLMGRIIDIAADQFQVIGIHLPPLSYGIIRPNFHNVPSLMFSSANYPQPALTHPCQSFIQQP